MKDIFGNAVKVGDYVAHVTRNGSYMNWSRRKVTLVADDFIETEWTTERWNGDAFKPKLNRTKVSLNFVVVSR